MFGALPAEVYGAALVFCRVGAVVMLLPGIGEQSVPPRIRLALAFVLMLAFFPLVRGALPTPAATVGGLGAQVGVEVLIGLAIGGLLRMFMGALAVAGETISLQTTLSFAQTANPGGPPTATLGTFLTVMAVALIFATNLHHLFLAAIVRSYDLFPVGRAFPVMDFGRLSIQTFGQAFSLGVQLAAPVIVFGLVFNIAAGFVGRVMPQFQIYFVAAPLTLILGMSVLALSLGLIGLVWLGRFRAFLEPLT